MLFFSLSGENKNSPSWEGGESAFPTLGGRGTNFPPPWEGG